jgi:hypothetical protein
MMTKQIRASHGGTLAGRPAGQRRGRNRKHRAGNKPRRHADHNKGDTAHRGNQQRFGYFKSFLA